MTTCPSVRMSRRRVIGLLGAGAGLSLVKPATDLLAAAQRGAAPIGFPSGAVIRTIVKDIAPDQFPNGTILFHEHLDGVYQRDPRQLKLPPPSSQDIAPAVAD